MALALDLAPWTSLVTIIVVWGVTVISPGPNFLATVQAALGHDRLAGLWVSAGIAVGTAIWAAASLLGLGLLFQSFAWLYLVVKIAGAAYLILFGLRLLLARGAAPSVTAAATTGGPCITASQAFWRGFLTDLSNPKAAAFFTSLFAVAVPPQAPLWFDGLTITTVVLIAGGWYGLVACTVALPRVAKRLLWLQAHLNRITGVVLIAFGLKLAFTERAEI